MWQMPFRLVEAKEKSSKKWKNGGAKGSVALLKEYTQLGCVSQDSGQRRNRSSTMLGDCEEFTSSILTTKNTKTFSIMRGENWNDLWHQPCLVKELRMASRKWLHNRRLHPRRLQKRCMVVQWNLMNPQDDEWNFPSLKIMKSTLQAKDFLRCHISFRFTRFSYAASAQGMEKAGSWKKSKARRKLSWRHKETKRKSSQQHWWNVTSRMRSWNQKCKGRVVLGGDIVKEDSGDYPVFTEQGSSASQMTAAKIMDVIARIPIMWRTNSWCSVCPNSGKIGGCSQIAQIS